MPFRPEEGSPEKGPSLEASGGQVPGAIFFPSTCHDLLVYIEGLMQQAWGSPCLLHLTGVLVRLGGLSRASRVLEGCRVQVLSQEGTQEEYTGPRAWRILTRAWVLLTWQSESAR
jgi:hypothetical protein